MEYEELKRRTEFAAFDPLTQARDIVRQDSERVAELEAKIQNNTATGPERDLLNRMRAARITVF